jgi:hypothetical protein
MKIFLFLTAVFTVLGVWLYSDFTSYYKYMDIHINSTPTIIWALYKECNGPNISRWKSMEIIEYGLMNSCTDIFLNQNNIDHGESIIDIDSEHIGIEVIEFDTNKNPEYK